MLKQKTIPVGLAIVLAIVAAFLIFVGLYFSFVMFALIVAGEVDHDGWIVSALAIGPLAAATWILWAVTRRHPTGAD